MTSARPDGSPPPFNYRGVTIAAVGVVALTVGWLVPFAAPASDYVAFGGWALGAVGTVLHFRDNNVAGDGLD